jgi:hypothetical protein
MLLVDTVSGIVLEDSGPPWLLEWLCEDVCLAVPAGGCIELCEWREKRGSDDPSPGGGGS